jgi:hypothetical protein
MPIDKIASVSTKRQVLLVFGEPRAKVESEFGAVPSVIATSCQGESSKLQSIGIKMTNPEAAALDGSGKITRVWRGSEGLISFMENK